MIRDRRPLPGMAIAQVWESRHNLTAVEHQGLAAAKWVRFAELDEIARPLVHDVEVKRGNLTVLGPRSMPLAYVVGPGLCLLAPGIHHATRGGWVRPGGEECGSDLSYDDRMADQQAEREALQRSRTNDSILEFEETRRSQIRRAERALRGA